MKIIKTKLEGVVIIEPQVFGDDRGFFLETWNYDKYRKAGLDVKFIQSNLSKSAQGVLRGLHFQNPKPQGKLVSVVEGEVFDVAVDIRKGSPTFAQWHGVLLSAENKKQFYIPEGFAHGFCVTSKSAIFSYMCTNIYDAQADNSIAWNDAQIAIKWPICEPVLSDKDTIAPSLDTIDPKKLPHY
jgi:dTDP-4-dehydrorhamnose 3,5-epimerase